MTRRNDLSGVFAVAWSQIQLDGLRDAPISEMDIGSSFRWSGTATRLDGPTDLFTLGAPLARQHRRANRAAHVAQRLSGQGRMKPLTRIQEDQEYLRKEGLLSLTDGMNEYVATVIELGHALEPLLVFHDALPPMHQDLWVLQYRAPRRRSDSFYQPPGAICFTPSTILSTPKGDTLIEHLRAGDLVHTKDNGPQEILWLGHKHMSGARLHALPHLRPIRIAQDALGGRRPTSSLLVSPDHNVLLKGARAIELFNTDEVFVTARDLVNRPGVSIDLTTSGITYIHILFDRHQVLFANGVETESFRPSPKALETLDPVEYERLLHGCPNLALEPNYYGTQARRNLSQSEAALLLHSAA